MVVGLGIDVLEIARMGDVVLRHGKHFLARILTAAELAAAPQSDRAKATYYAGRWAAKEAVSKALGTGIGIGILAGKSVEAAARQPESVGQIQKLMILAIAFIEALCLYALLVAFTLAGKGKAEASAESELSHGDAPAVEAHP